MTKVLKCNSCNIVCDELLCFIQNKLSVADDDTLVRLCLSSFTSDEIKMSKSLLFESVSTDLRLISRKNTGKETRDLEDVLGLLRSIESEKVPVFVARNLDKLPPITVDHIDCTKFIKDLEKIKRDMKKMLCSYVTNDQFEELRQDVHNMKYASLPRTTFSAVNTKRGAWLHNDSGPIGLSHYNNESEGKKSPSPSTDTQISPRSSGNISKLTKYRPIKDLNASTLKCVELDNNKEEITQDSVSSIMNHASQLDLTQCRKPTTGESSSLNSPIAAVTYCDDPQFRENNTDGWTKVTYKRNKHNYRYTGKRGTACDTECYAKFMAAERKIPIFISNVNKNCLETDITEYIRAKTKENIVLEKLNTKKKMHNAYKFYVFESKVSLFLDPELWPQNIVYRRFMHYRPNITKRQTNVGGPLTLING